MGYYKGGIVGDVDVFSGVALVKDCVNRCQIEAYEDYSDGGVAKKSCRYGNGCFCRMRKIEGNIC